MKPSDQLQKSEDSAPDNLEFERLKEHFEPFIRASSASSSVPHHLRATQHIHSNPVTAAASDALSRDVPGVSEYNPLSRSRVGCDKQNRNEMLEYRSRMDITLTGCETTNVGRQHLTPIPPRPFTQILFTDTGSYEGAYLHFRHQALLPQENIKCSPARRPCQVEHCTRLLIPVW